MSEKRRDHRGRILHNGEIQLSDGRYRFKYVDEMGKERCVYSWRLDHNDATPKGKRRALSLREMEKKIQADHFEQIATNGGNMTVLEQCWLIHLQQVEKKSYSSIHSIRGVLRPAFQLAVDDDLIRKNPFQFQLMEVVVNDSVTREAISRAEERKFLRFVKEDPHFCRYYEGIYILFKTGLRISEFCGLTISDIDFKEHTINIDHQLQKKSKIGYYIQETKTTSGTRKIPMTADVEECFRKIIEKRNPPKAEPMVDGKSGFLYFDKNGSICYSLHWEHYFQHIIQKYNNTYKVQMNVITPHVCRHTYCSNMAKSGMNPKALQYLMGHSDISVTLNTYTHVNLEDAREEIARLRIV